MDSIENGKEYIERLKQGVNVWNSWRKANPDVNVDLTGCDLTNFQLQGVDLSGLTFKMPTLPELTSKVQNWLDVNCRGPY